MIATRTLLVAAVAAAMPALAAEKWVKMFDGKTLNGWKASEKPENWTVEDGTIHGKGERSHLFWMGKECGDCEFKAEVKLAKGANSGMYFRAKFMTSWPEGYEAQVNNSYVKDPKKTGSLYNFKNVMEQLVPDDTWWTQHIIAKGNHIIIKVNDKVVVDFVDEKNSFMKGYLALQQHDPGSQVWYRKLEMRPIK